MLTLISTPSCGGQGEQSGADASPDAAAEIGADASACPPAGSCDASSPVCTRSDWEHDWECDCALPEGNWICCSAQYSGVVCEGCGEEAGTPCCSGQANPVDPSLVCVAGHWQSV
jgi:hypothetical protein